VSVRGIGWYGAAFIALIVSVVFIGVAAASFFASLTPLYVSIVCSVAAVAFGVVAAVRARPADGAPPGEAPEPAATEEPRDSDEPVEGTQPVEAAEPAEATEPAEAAQPGDSE